LAAAPVPFVVLVTPPITYNALAVAAPTAEAALREVIRQQNRGGGKDYGRLLNSLVQRVGNLNAELMETQPTSARGSAELLRVAAGRFPFHIRDLSNGFTILPTACRVAIAAVQS
jgi:hypothetical protein